MLEDLKGRLDYWFRPGLRSSKELYSFAWRGVGPMNGQPARRKATETIINAGRIQGIVETGTYRAVTTEWLAQFDLPVISVEVNPRLYAYSVERMRHRGNVRLLNRSSHDAIWDIGQLNFPKSRVFFYLDAHWDADVPLQEELEQIFSDPWHEPVVMIDDFEVPGDSYMYLDRGPGKRLTADVLGPYVNMPRWYPATPAYQEPGTNTGWCVIAADALSVKTLDSIAGLRRSDEPVVLGPGAPISAQG